MSRSSRGVVCEACASDRGSFSRTPRTLASVVVPPAACAQFPPRLCPAFKVMRHSGSVQVIIIFIYLVLI